MSSSISGQNERWAQLGAYQPPPISQSGQNPGWGSTNWTTASGGTNASTASAGGASGAQSNDMSFALMAFGNASGNGSVTSSQSAGQSGDASSSGSAAQVGSSLGSQLLTDMQSLLSSLTGTAGAATDTTNASANTGTTTATGLGGSLLQDLQTVASAFSSTASGSGPTPSGTVGGPPPWRNDIANTGTNAGNGSTGGWHPGYSDSFQNQYALAAYAASIMPSLNSPATSSLGAVNA